MKSRLNKESLVYHLKMARENLQLIDEDDPLVDHNKLMILDGALRSALTTAMQMRNDLLLAKLPIKKDGV